MAQDHNAPGTGNATGTERSTGSERTERFEVAADQIMSRLKQLLHEGNVRRVIVKQGDETVAEFPLTFGVVGTVLAPVLAAVGALAALLTKCTIEVHGARRGRRLAHLGVRLEDRRRLSPSPRGLDVGRERSGGGLPPEVVRCRARR